MGLLDDAIRDHLELKRRHGAAEDEVRRQEQEALGPPRRGEVPEPLAPPAPVQEAEPELAEAEPDPEAAGETGPPAPEPAPPAAAAYAAPGPAPEPEPDSREDEPWLEEAARPTPAPEPAHPGAADGDDVLEATPEFLQETPEHDRLWFEQKPPKDFDFDK